MEGFDYLQLECMNWSGRLLQGHDLGQASGWGEQPGSGGPISSVKLFSPAFLSVDRKNKINILHHEIKAQS